MQARVILGRRMRTLSIQARTAETAHHLHNALATFGAEVIEQDDTFAVRVDLSDAGADIASLLNAIERYVADCEAGPALIDLDGRTYTMAAP